MAAALLERPDETSALRYRRIDAAGAPTQASTPAPLGVLAYGLPVADGGLGLRVLQGQAGRVDAWHGGVPAVAGETGPVRWRDDGHWLFGRIDVDETNFADLAEAAAHVYRHVFGTLREAGRPHLLRLWNYVPRINADDAGLERYRRFNIGRQQAFIDAGRDAFEGAPAACAIGKRDGLLSLRFLAGRTPPRPLENPRQVPAYRYAPRFGPRSPTFSRAALVDAAGGQLALLVSGTASIVGQDSLHAGDVRAQTRETLANLQALLAAARECCTAPFELGGLDCTVYLRHAADLAAVRDEFERATGPGSRAPIFIEADICRSELLVEIEGQTMAPGGLR